MASPAHPSLDGALLALVFASVLFAALWMLRTSQASAEAEGAGRSPDRASVILVPVTSSSESQRRVELACQLAREQRATLLLVYLIEVPWTLPLDATLEQADQEARAALETAREVAARHPVPVETVVQRTRVARDGIAAAAKRHQVDLVFDGRGPRERGWRPAWGRPGPR